MPGDRTWKRGDPLERIEGESLAANQAFRDYVHMQDRSLKKLWEWYRETGGKPGVNRGRNPPIRRLSTLEELSAKFFWQERLAAYDAEKKRLLEKRYQERRELIEEQKHELAQLFFEKVKQMLAFRLVEVETTRDGKNVTIKPTKWTQKDTAAFARVFSELTDGGRQSNSSSLSDEQLWAEIEQLETEIGETGGTET